MDTSAQIGYHRPVGLGVLNRAINTMSELLRMNIPLITAAMLVWGGPGSGILL